MPDPLAAFARSPGPDLPVALLILDPGLVRAVQTRLTHHGLLDPGADGYLGPVTQWALAEFCRSQSLPFSGTLTPSLATALLTPADPLPTGSGLASRLAQALLHRGQYLPRHPGCLSIVYAEATAPSGTPTPARPDAFDDARFLLRMTRAGPELAGAWDATTAPGRPAVEATAGGAPRLAPGQYKAWIMGRTAIGTEFEQDALIQAAPLPVTRDANRDFRRDGDPAQTGLFIIDQHGGRDAAPDQIGPAGAGCLLGRSQPGHTAFLALLRQDPRFQASNAYRFMTTLLEPGALSHTAPSEPHRQDRKGE